jgi:hypothetical protein
VLFSPAVYPTIQQFNNLFHALHAFASIALSHSWTLSGLKIFDYWNFQKIIPSNIGTINATKISRNVSGWSE